MMVTLFSFALLASVAVSEQACQDGSRQCVSEESDEMNLMQIPDRNAPADSTLEEYITQHATFENQSAMDEFIQKHKAKWSNAPSLLGATSKVSRRNTKERSGNADLADEKEMMAGSSSLLSAKSGCALKYNGQYFKPRENICENSFTGIGSCSEQGCYILTTFFYPDSCHPVYYSNADSMSSGFGMCRCMPKTASTINRYYSSSGNNIYSCTSLV